MAGLVSIVHYSALPVIGGVEFIISEHSELMRKDGLEVHLIAGDGNPDILIPELSASYYEDIQCGIMKGREPDNFKEEVKKLKNKLGKFISGSDTLIVHNLFSMHFNLVATAALSEISDNYNTIGWVHDISYIDPTYNLPPPDILPLQYISRPQSNVKYVTITEYRKDKLVEFYSIDNGIVNVIPNGIDPLMMLPEDMKDAAEKLNILSFYPVIIYPSRLTRRKNYELAVRITSLIGDKPLLLLTAPPDPHNPAFSTYKEELKSIACEENVSLIFFSDYCNIREIYPFYFLGDLLLITSRMEGFGLPALESALFRIPAALSSIPPLREIGKNFEDCLFFELDCDPSLIADRITDMLRNNTISKNRRAVIKNYSWDKIYKERIKKLL